MPAQPSQSNHHLPSRNFGRRCAWPAAAAILFGVTVAVALTQLVAGTIAAATGAILVAVLAILVARWRLIKVLEPLDALQAGLTGLGDDEPLDLPSRAAAALGDLAGAFEGSLRHARQHRDQARRIAQEAVDTQREIVQLLGEAVENRSDETGSHTARVGHAAALLASLAGLSDTEAETVRLAAPMHDVGKIGIPDSILNKPGSLTHDEIAIMKTHTTIGHEILVRSERPILQAAATIAHQHHESWDGSGYPRGLKGEDIHIHGRIVAIVDCFDALTSNRVYRCAMDPDKTLEFMKSRAGTAFDPHLMETFLAHSDRFTVLMEKYDRSPVDCGDHTELHV